MKILVLTDDWPGLRPGGAGVIAQNTARSLAERGHEVLIVTTSDNGPHGEAFNQLPYKLTVLKAGGSERLRSYRAIYNYRLLKQVKRIIDNFKPNIVHAHNIHRYLSYACLKAAKRSGARVFLTAHDLMLVAPGKLFPDRDGNFKPPSWWRQFKVERWRFNPFKSILVRHYLKYVDRIIAVSQAVKDVLDLAGIKRVTVLHNGIDLSDWQVGSAAVQAFKSKHNLIGKKVILFGGRVSGAKGREVALKAFKIVRSKIPQAVLLVAGETNINQDGVLVLGWLSREEMKLAYASAQVVLTPSLYLDPFPTVNLEAMVMAKPVVGTIFGGTKEAIVNNETGLLLNPSDVESLANALVVLLLDEVRTGTYGQAGRRRAEEYFSQDRHIEKLLALYHNPKVND